MHLNEMRDQRGSQIASARAILEKAEEEKRELTPEEDQEYQKHFDAQNKTKLAIEREEKQQEIEREAAERQLKVEKAEGKDTATDSPEAATREALMGTFRSWLKNGKMPSDIPEEFRALQADVDTAGGYLVPPEEFVQDLIKAVDDQVFIRQLATVFQLTEAASLGAPALDADPADADWTAEVASISADSTMAFGKRELKPNALSKLIKVSRKFLRIGALNPETIVRDRLAYKFGISEEKGFMTGTGASQPLGLYTASSDGISTSRDASSGSATSITADALISAKYDLKGQYYPNAKWNFHRDGVEIIAKLKDANNQYIWRPGLADAEPDRLLGFPVLQSEYTPNTFTTGLYVGMLGDYSHYWIAESLAIEIQRLVELYAENSQVGFIGRAEVDGMPVLEEAFVRLKTD